MTLTVTFRVMLLSVSDYVHYFGMMVLAFPHFTVNCSLALHHAPKKCWFCNNLIKSHKLIAFVSNQFKNAACQSNTPEVNGKIKFNKFEKKPRSYIVVRFKPCFTALDRNRDKSECGYQESAIFSIVSSTPGSLVCGQGLNVFCVFFRPLSQISIIWKTFWKRQRCYWQCLIS